MTKSTLEKLPMTTKNINKGVVPQADQLARSYLQKLVDDAKKQQADRAKTEQAMARTGGRAKARQRGNRGAISLAIRPDLALTAVLLARAVEKQTRLQDRLRHGGIGVVRLDDEALSSCVKTILSKCVIGGPAYSAFDYRSRLEESFLLVESKKHGFREELINDLATAISQAIPVLGLITAKDEQLPQLLLDCSEGELVLCEPDPSAIAVALEYATGDVTFPVFTSEIAKHVTVTDLIAAVRPGRTAGEAHQHIVRLVESRENGRNSNALSGDNAPSLEQLHGYGDAKTWGLEAAADLKAYMAGAITWDECDHRGLLLSGPPGVGKSLYARAFAKTAGLPLIATSVADWNAAPHLGGTLKAISASFAQARSKRPSILFIDELDGISSRSRIGGDYAEYWMQIVNLLLEEMQGASESNEGVVIIGATNLPDRIDPAVLRSGRLDNHIQIRLPEFADIKEIYRYCSAGAALGDDALSRLAAASINCSGADIEAYVRRAKGAARRSKEHLSEAHILAEIRSVHSVLPPEVQRRVAIHEAGHAVMHHITKHGKFQHLALTKTGGQLASRNAPQGYSSQADFDLEILVLLAGYAAEVLVFGDVVAGYANGASSDLQLATSYAVASRLVFEDRVGFVGNALTEIPGMYQIVSDRIGSAIETAKKAIMQEMPLLHAVADALQCAHYLDKAAFDKICAQYEAKEVSQCL